MGEIGIGIEQKIMKIENLMNKGKYDEAVSQMIDLLKTRDNNIPASIYSKLKEAIKNISEKEKDDKIKFKAFISSFLYFNELDKDSLREKIINLFRNKSQTEIEQKIKSIKILNDFELNCGFMKLLDKKIMEEGKQNLIPSDDIDSIDNNIRILKNIYQKLQTKSLKKSILDKIIDNFINKSQKIIENLITLNEERKIKEQLLNLDRIKKDIKDIDIIVEENKNEAKKYIESLEKKGKSYLLMVEGIHLMEKKKFKQAYDKFFSIEDQQERYFFQIEIKEIECIKAIGESSENEENYDDALNFYQKNQKFKEDINRVNILKSFIDAKKSIKEKKYEEAFEFFKEMYVKRKEILNTPLIEEIFTDCGNVFLTTLSLYCKEIWPEKDNKSLEDHKKKIEVIRNKIDNTNIKKHLFEVINFITDIISSGREITLKTKIMNINIINKRLSEMNQRIYLKILLNRLFSEINNDEKKTILNIIIKYGKEGLYISKEDLIKLRELLNFEKTKGNIELFKQITELYYIFSENRIDLEKNTFILIGNTIALLTKEKNNKQKPNLITDNDYDDIMINLFNTFLILTKSRDYKLTNVEKIYNLILSPKIKNTKLLYTLLNGYFYFFEKEFILSNKSIDNLLNILLEKEENQKLFDIIFSTFEKNKDLYIDYVPKFFKLILLYPKEEDILNLLKNMNLPYKVITKIEFLKTIDEYLNQEVYCDLIFEIIKQIKISDRTNTIMEKIYLYEQQKEDKEKDSHKRLESAKYKRKRRLKNYQNLIKKKESLNVQQLKDIEDNLSIYGFYDLLIKLLENQKDLIGKVNLDIISQFFNKKHYDDFIGIFSNKNIIWTEKPLSIIIRGFSKNDEEEKQLIIQFLEKIKQNQSLPKIIEASLQFEKNFYEQVKKIENSKSKLRDLLDKFKDIKYFSNKYYENINTLILSFINGKDNNKNMIYNIIFELLKFTSFNVSPAIFKICIEEISLDDFRKHYSFILSNMRIQLSLKKILFDKINYILKNEDREIKLEIIKKMKNFVDYEMIPSETIAILCNDFEINSDGSYNEISKEILYILGIICSTANTKEKNMSQNFYETIRNDELYKEILSKSKDLKENYIIYLYSLIIYFGKNKDVEKGNYKDYPRNILLTKIKNKLKTVEERNNFEYNFLYFEKIHEFERFSPKRDKYIRKLFYNERIDVNKINKIIVEKSNIESRVEKTVGEKKINGKLFGKGIIYYTNGEIFDGYFFNNIKEGEGLFYKNETAKGIKQIWRDGKLLENNKIII